jgi:dTDP-4-amino-4,6-dideoxygalactose transaminase
MVPSKIRDLCIGSGRPIWEALQILETSHKGIVLVVDVDEILIGTVTDGDIRRALLAGKLMEVPLVEVMCRNPVTGEPKASKREQLDLMNRHKIAQLPIVDPDGRIVDVALLAEVVQVNVPLSDIDFGEVDIDAVVGVMRSGWLSMGDMTGQFERLFTEFSGARHAIAVTNGTAALHLACVALGLGEGDEVLCPSLSFVATSNAVLYTGAMPVFCEVKGDGDLTIDPEDLVGRITPRTKAIMVMHYGGYACDMPSLTKIANEHGLYLIEDVAHAPGARLGGRDCGTWGDVGCFSFFANKNMTTGEGGMVTTNSDELAEKLRLLRSHGMTTMTLDRHLGRAYSYDVVELGYNYRLDEMRAALGVVQLGQLAAFNARRRQLVVSYKALLADVPGVSVPFSGSEEREAACHIMPVLLDPDVGRSFVMRQMREAGIQTSIHYPAIHMFSYYSDFCPTHLPKTEDISSRQVTLPLYPTMTESQVEKVVGVLTGAVASTKDLEHSTLRP